ncbi:MAG: M15 family metallopeptidase [Treponema sp.]|nr:M15 family metallopeptidase [Treponema sp.]
MFRFVSVCFVLLFFLTCVTDGTYIDDLYDINEIENIPVRTSSDNRSSVDFPNVIRIVMAADNALLPPNIKSVITNNISNQIFNNELNFILQNVDRYFWILVDKENSLSSDYIPQNLVHLQDSSFRVNRNDLFLRSIAVTNLEEMSIAAAAEGLTIIVSSAYRSYVSQEQIYTRNVNQMGRQAADRVSARPGHSQHQLGTTVDFGSITNAFAQTREGRWITANASSFGWSLSYPDGYEHVTGYSWESWHYRYVGKEVAAFIDKYFDGIQQYALRFLHEYSKLIQNN